MDFIPAVAYHLCLNCLQHSRNLERRLEPISVGTVSVLSLTRVFDEGPDDDAKDLHAEAEDVEDAGQDAHPRLLELLPEAEQPQQRRDRRRSVGRHDGPEGVCLDGRRLGSVNRLRESRVLAHSDSAGREISNPSFSQAQYKTFSRPFPAFILQP